MGITFEHARAIADAHYRPLFDGHGTFIVAPWGFADDEFYLVLAGASECIVDGDPDYLILGDPAQLVDRETGEVVELSYIGNLDKLDAMRPVGTQDALAIR